MSAMYARIKKYYDYGMWTAGQVKQAVVKGKITAEEYSKITGNVYNND